MLVSLLENVENWAEIEVLFGEKGTRCGRDRWLEEQSIPRSIRRQRYLFSMSSRKTASLSGLRVHCDVGETVAVDIIHVFRSESTKGVPEEGVDRLSFGDFGIGLGGAARGWRPEPVRPSVSTRRK